MRRGKINLDLTPRQIEEIISCIKAADDYSLATGQVTTRELNLVHAYRRRIIDKLEKLLAA